jgi:hypothetical protein
VPATPGRPGNWLKFRPYLKVADPSQSGIHVVQFGTAAVNGAGGGSFPKAVTPGNTVVLVCAGYVASAVVPSTSGPSYNSITTGWQKVDERYAPFGQNAGSGDGAYIVCYVLGGAYTTTSGTSVSLATTTNITFDSALGLVALEIMGLGNYPQLDGIAVSSASVLGTETTATSGTGALTTKPNEIVIAGYVSVNAATGDPAAPWVVDDVAADGRMSVGYQIVSAGQQLVYSHTQNAGEYAGFIINLYAGNSPPVTQPVTQAPTTAPSPQQPVQPYVIQTQVSTVNTESGPFNITLLSPVIAGFTGDVWGYPVVIAEPVLSGPPPPNPSPQVFVQLQGSTETGAFNIILPDVLLPLTGIVWNEPVLTTEPPKPGPTPPNPVPQVFVQIQGHTETGSFNIILPGPALTLAGDVWAQPVLVAAVPQTPQVPAIKPQVLPQAATPGTESGAFNITLPVPALVLAGDVWSAPVVVAVPVRGAPPPPPLPPQVLVQIQGHTETGNFNITLPTSTLALTGIVWTEPVLLTEPAKLGPPPPNPAPQVFVQLQGSTEAGNFNITLPVPKLSLSGYVSYLPVLLGTAAPGPPPPPLAPQLYPRFYTPPAGESGTFNIVLPLPALAGLTGDVWASPVLLVGQAKPGAPPSPIPPQLFVYQRLDSGPFNIVLPAPTLSLSGFEWSEPVLLTEPAKPGPPPPPIPYQIITRLALAEQGLFNITLPNVVLSLSGDVWSYPVVVTGIARSGAPPPPISPQIIERRAGTEAGQFNVVLPDVVLTLSGDVWARPVLLYGYAASGIPPTPTSPQTIFYTGYIPPVILPGCAQVTDETVYTVTIVQQQNGTVSIENEDVDSVTVSNLAAGIVTPSNVGNGSITVTDEGC